MNREEYLRELARELRRVPREEYEKAMDYYTEFFDDAGPEQESKVIADLGDPKDVAAQIIMDAAMERMNHPVKSVKRGFSTIWIVILALCAAPIALPMAIAVIVMVGSLLIMAMALLGSAMVLVIGSFAAGVVSLVCGLIGVFLHPASGLTALGMGMGILGISILGGMLLCWIFKWMVRGVRALFRKIVKKGEKA